MTFINAMSFIWPRNWNNKPTWLPWLAFGFALIYLAQIAVDANQALPPYKYFIMGLGLVTAIEVFVFVWRGK